MSTRSKPSRADGTAAIIKKADTSACEIAFKDLSFSVNVAVTEDKRKSFKEKPILKSISGVFRPGRFTAIMGASGAGKTSFLNVIAGEAKVGMISGEILINGQPVTSSAIKKISGFVFQEDVILSTMTVKEAIAMSAQLRLPNTLSDEEKEKRVDHIIRDLNLTKCQDTIIGDIHIKGVSGGERKRCAMAMEMVTQPKVLFLDEPTSGLDTFTAFSVVHTLRELAHRRNQTYIATIHQPSSQLFRLFDDLLLLSEGRVMYQGPTSEAVAYFSQHKFSCPIRSNPADYFFYHILNNQDGALMPHTDEEEKEDETNAERIERMLGVWERSEERVMIMKRIEGVSGVGIPADSERYWPAFSDQVSLVFLTRTVFSNANTRFRDPLVLRTRLIQTVFISLIVGLLYLNNFCSFLVVMNFMLSTQAHLSSFIRHKVVFMREYGAGYYGLPAFFFSKILTEMPLQLFFPWLQVTMIYFMAGTLSFAFSLILSSISGFALGVFLACSFSSLAVALNASTTLLLPMMLVSGLFVNAGAMPQWISWIKYLSPIKYSFEGSMRSQVGDTVEGTFLIKNIFGDVNLSVLTNALLLVATCFLLFAMGYLNLSSLVNKKSKVTRLGVKKA
ncbi:P-loop containing nucleoside triphosphate hydrolase protein [Chytridium lagenaria]|nr:P-loop containing nucleoside triphosphate hydrolase protein [Chytridium lagenaria]